MNAPGQPPAAPHSNRLAKETSPYLLQHAANPVDWYPWGEEAFARARSEDRPILLSIGYSTCHWCHVMERESFENEAIAKILNENFVCIKVDREERPDVDQVYMTSVMRLTGQGGWPLTVFLTPDLEPFYGGTYYPPEDRGPMPGLPHLALSIAEAWRTRRAEVLESAGALVAALQPDIAARDGRGVPGIDALRLGEAQFARMFDPVHGGFGGAPKFPRAHVLSFLLRWWKRTSEPGALERVEKTLAEMDAGGIHDHLGGGFHRYSVDERWLVPHFEKMLYDQAILARASLDAYRATGKPAYARMARDIFDYVLRDLTAPGGGFYSAEDADSEGVEGKFYVWTPGEIAKLLGPDDAALVMTVYGVTEEGNFEHGWSILHRTPGAKPLTADEQRRLDAARARLLEARGKRIRPHLDDKILTDWNGLMIGALAEGGAVLDEPRFERAAERAAQFLLASLRSDGRLLHSWRDGSAKVPGFLDDHAFFGLGLLDLYESTLDPRWLREAVGIAEAMNRLFRDEKQGGWFLTGRDHQVLPSRPKELYDGAVMSGNAMATLLLLRVGHLTASAALEEEGRGALAAFGAEIALRPAAYPQMLSALDFAIGPVKEIVISGDREDPRTAALLREVRKRYLPNSVIANRPSGPEGEAILSLIPYLEDQVALEGRPTAYVCEKYTCQRPVRDPEALGKLLGP